MHSMSVWSARGHAMQGHQTGWDVELRGIRRSYGRKVALQGLDLSLPAGTILGLLGPNGAGKSTTMRLLAGLLEPTAGTLRIGPAYLPDDRALVRTRLGYMPEDNPLPEDLRVEEYLRWRARLKGYRGEALKRQVARVLDACDLARTARRKMIGTLSRGFRQRVGVAEAFLGQPALLLLDEPTLGLDPHQVLAMRQLLQEGRGQSTLVVSSHLLAEVEMICDQVLILHQGVRVACGSFEALRKAFLGGCIYELRLNGPREGLGDRLERVVGAHVLEELTPERPEMAFRELLLRTESFDDQGAALLETLAQDGRWTLQALRAQPASLEAIFLAATRRAWDTAGEPAAQAGRSAA